MYRIRQAIGQDVIVFENDRYQFNRKMSFRWDREEFEHFMGQAQQTTALHEKQRLLEQAIALLKGEYLADLDADWVIPDRLKYQEAHQFAMLELAAIYLQSGLARECLNIARQVLQSDALLESAHRLIIQAYASLHDPANMTLQYRKYQQALENELGIEPSSEISTLYERLMAEI
jgi:two-component SAPR family response regulator